jgi:hypothetical protein
MVAIQGLLGNGYPAPFGRQLREDSMLSTKPRSSTTCAYRQVIGSRHSGATARANTAFGSVTSIGSASNGWRRGRRTLR